MTKYEFINTIQSQTGGTKKDAELLVNATFTAMTGAITDDGRFSYPGFGTFTLKNRAERQGRNPRTGEAITIPASKSVGFKASTNLKSIL